MPVTRNRSRRLVEARLWTGSAAHLVGGGADLAGALARHLLAKVGARTRAWVRALT